MNYVDFDYYANQFKGKLSSDTFDFYVVKACKEIDNNVNKKITTEDITDDVKYVACELIDALYELDVVMQSEASSGNERVASISIDGVSKTYQTLSENDKATAFDNFLRKKRYILNGLPISLTRYL